MADYIPEERTEHGRMLIDLIDSTAVKYPSRVVAYIPKSSQASDGWTPLSYKEYANAVNVVAHEIIKVVGDTRTEDKVPTIAYIGPNDIRYPLFMTACVKARCQGLFMSPRNTTEIQLSLFERTDCRHIFFEQAFEKSVQLWLKEREMEAVSIPSFNSWLHAPEAEPVPYSRTPEQGFSDPLMVLHTSGSTGIPKPVFVRQGLYMIGDKFHEHPKFEGDDSIAEFMVRCTKKWLLAMPMFHAAGLYMSTFWAPYWGVPVVYLPTGRPLEAGLIIEVLQEKFADAGVFPPSILEDIAGFEGGPKLLSHLSFAMFGGGPLNSKIGNYLVEQGVNVSTAIASTENSPYPGYEQRDRKLWEWFHLDSELSGFEWIPVPEEGPDMFELVIKRSQDPKILQPVFATFPDEQEFQTKDLFQRHPERKNCWKHMGRRDDIVVFANGEKLNPVSIERAVSAHELVHGAVVVGAKRFQAALILEPAHQISGEDEAKAFIDQVWPTVEEINKSTVAHGRISREYIAIAEPDKPFARAGKGSIQRGNTLRIYADFIDKFYDKASGGQSASSITLDFSSVEKLAASILEVFKVRYEISDLQADTDFFQHGIDSIQVVTVSKILSEAIAKEDDGKKIKIAPSAVYANPSATALAKHLMQKRGETNGKAAGDDEAKQGAQLVLKP